MTITLSCLNEGHVFPYRARPNGKAVVPLRQMDEETRKEFWANLALRYCKGIGVRTRARLLNYYGSAYIAIENRKNWRDAKVRAECAREFAREDWRAQARKEWDEAAASKASILLWTSAFYPQRFRELADPPSFLYCLGDLSLLTAPMLGVVGSRQASTEALQNARVISRALSEQGISVISGMALGIDREAHLGALEKAGKSVGVLGTGIEIFYPFTNKDVYSKMLEEGLLLSEFSPKQPAAGVNFPIRNRLISGLSLGVLVIEAAERSGSLITAHYALEQNREVFAIPGSHKAPGCMNLIREGAHPVRSVNDIILELGDLLREFQHIRPPADGDLEIPALPDPPEEEGAAAPEQDAPAPNEEFDGREEVEKCCQDDLAERILTCLQKGSPHIEDLALELQADVREINSKLIFLELLGKIRRLPGARFEAI